MNDIYNECMHDCKHEGEAAISSTPSRNLIVPMTSSTLQIQPFPAPWDSTHTRTGNYLHAKVLTCKLVREACLGMKSKQQEKNDNTASNL